MPQSIHMLLAQQIVDTLKTICDHDINFIDVDGRIRASTDPQRVDGYHVGGHEAARSGQIVTIQKDDPARELRHGINMPIRFHGKIVAVVGITGPPAEVRRYADLAQRLTLLLLREQEMDARTYDVRAQTSHLVRALTEGDSLNPEFVEAVLQKNGLTDQGESWRTVVIRMKTVSGKPLMELEYAIQGVIEGLGKVLFTFLYPGEFRLLFREADFARGTALLSELAARYPEALRLGIGSARRLLRQDRSCKAARLVLQSLEPGKNYGVYESMGLELLLGRIGRCSPSISLWSAPSRRRPPTSSSIKTPSNTGSTGSGTAAAWTPAASGRPAPSTPPSAWSESAERRDRSESQVDRVGILKLHGARDGCIH